MEAPSGAVDSSGILERERGVKVAAGDPLLVAALVSEGAPVRESKVGGGGIEQDDLNGAPTWILNPLNPIVHF